MKKGLAVIAVVICCILVVGVKLYGDMQGDQRLEAAIESVVDSEIVQGEDVPPYLAYMNAVRSAVSYDIQSNDKKGTAVVSFTYVDVMGLAQSVSPEGEELDGFYQNAIEQIQSGSAPMKSETIEVTYHVGEEKEYILDVTPALANVLTGGAFEVIQGLVEGEMENDS